MRSSAFWEDIHSPFDRLRERSGSNTPTPHSPFPIPYSPLLYIKVKNYPVFSRKFEKKKKKYPV
jgi:hypothetical protein